MTAQRMLITGAGGMLGRALSAALREAGADVLGFDHTGLDITDAAAVRAAVLEACPDVVINSAAATHVDGCESAEEEAFGINGLGAGHVAAAAAAVNALVVQVSTDYVFDGTAGRPYDESDPVAPISVYGRSKWYGEFLVREATRRHLIVRTQWLFGLGSRNFVDTILRAASAKPELRVVDDQIGCPTWVPHLARQIRALVAADAVGTFHASAGGMVSWCGFARAIVQAAGLATPVVPIPTAELDLPATRPLYSPLRNRRLELLGMDSMPGWEDGLRGYLAERASEDENPRVNRE